MPVAYSPLLLSTPVTLSTDTGSAQANPTDLLNPNASPMLIDQFRFAMEFSDDGHGADQQAVFLEQVYVNIMVGAVQLTNGFVPVVSLCPNYDYTLTEATGFTAANLPPTNPLVWHLPKPMYVPPNVVTFMNFMRVISPQWDGESVSALNLRAIVAGRSLPSNAPIPGQIYAPWGCATVVDNNRVEALGDTNTWVSRDNELGNPNDSPMMITRFVGYQSAESDFNGLTLPGSPTVQMTISSGKQLIRSPTPFYHLFPQSRRYCDLRGVLKGSDEQPGGQFVKTKIVMAVDDAITEFPMTTIGMIGYRVVQTPGGAAQPAP